MEQSFSPAVLRRYLDYNPETGLFLWRARQPADFDCARMSSDVRCRIWNSRHSNTAAFTTPNDGYLTGRILGRTFKAHRVAWAIHFGEWPTGQIDHINGDKTDNRIANLRDVSGSTNCRNLRPRKTNTSGCVGVHLWVAAGRTPRWVAKITYNGRQRTIGYFKTKEDAVAARLIAEREHDYLSS